MTVVREPRLLNLRLHLPEISNPRPPAAENNRFSSFAADLEKLKVLGHGSGGTVYKVRHKATSETYAIKLIHGGATTDPASRRQLIRETDILRHTDSPHVVRCHGIFERPSVEIAILMEYMDSGTLETLLRSQGTFSESELADVARKVLKGLHYLHSHKIVHRDTKPANILVNSKMEVKIADFGVGKILCRTLEACTTYVGTCAYMSPERFDPGTYGGEYDGSAGDIWSLGLTLMKLYMGHFPLFRPGQRSDFLTLMFAICFGEPLASLHEGASEEFRSSLGCCLQKESSKRWSATQLLGHPFVRL
ncbi:Tyrosine-protein kinase [Parasponia andersonii]|uniref:mitogen-activated protein kinase kinase n=1 Tax=Parasponia andersonii TaxID=3476 RepID=A0A2P5AXB2_PARAD|nr:Tyrosine-protein kinase [Parasponia andersonii]